jgi:hypothetical protein
MPLVISLPGGRSLRFHGAELEKEPPRDASSHSITSKTLFGGRIEMRQRTPVLRLPQISEHPAPPPPPPRRNGTTAQRSGVNVTRSAPTSAVDSAVDRRYQKWIMQLKSLHTELDKQLPRHIATEDEKKMARQQKAVEKVLCGAIHFPPRDQEALAALVSNGSHTLTHMGLDVSPPSDR